MADSNYRKRLAADVPKWLAAGWVTADGATAILASAGTGNPRRLAFSFSAILGTLGALLLGLAVLAWVGAQWEEVPRLFRFGLIALALLVAYGAASEFERRDLRIFAEAGLLAGGLIFAGGIALVGQTYHLAGDFSGALMLFDIGVLGAALFTGSPTMTVLGLIGAGYWAWVATVEGHVAPHWPSLVAILLGVLVSTVQNSHYGRIVAVLAVMYWITLAIFGMGDAHDWSFVGGITLYAEAALALWALGAALASLGEGNRLALLGDAILWPGLFAILVTIGLLQIADRPLHLGETSTTIAVFAGGASIVLAAAAFVRKEITLGDLIAIAVLAIGALLFAAYLPSEDLARNIIGGVLVILAALWAVTLGQAGSHPIGKSIGLVAFGLEVIYLYVFTIGTRLDTALAFLLGGVLFIVLAVVLFRLDRALSRRSPPALVAPPPPVRPTPDDGGPLP